MIHVRAGQFYIVPLKPPRALLTSHGLNCVVILTGKKRKKKQESQVLLERIAETDMVLIVHDFDETSD